MSAAATIPVQAPPPRRVGDVLALTTAYLARHGIENPSVCGEWLLAHHLNCTRSELALRTGRTLAPPILDDVREGLRRLGRGEPLQYVLGEWDFRGHRLRVDDRALIPRPETEQLVQQVLDEPSLWCLASPYLADVGTGSGCIAVSLALERPSCRLVALDVSPTALALASHNAATQGVADRISFQCGELGAVVFRPELDAIVTNPPYVSTPDLSALPRNVRDYEPRTALDGGFDGLQVIRRICHDAVLTLKPGGRLLMEIGETQVSAVSAMMANAGFESIRQRHDLTGRPRFVLARMGL